MVRLGPLLFFANGMASQAATAALCARCSASAAPVAARRRTSEPHALQRPARAFRGSRRALDGPFERLYYLQQNACVAPFEPGKKPTAAARRASLRAQPVESGAPRLPPPRVGAGPGCSSANTTVYWFFMLFDLVISTRLRSNSEKVRMFVCVTLGRTSTSVGPRRPRRGC